MTDATTIREMFEQVTLNVDGDDSRLRDWQIEFCYLVTDIENGSPVIAQLASDKCLTLVETIKQELGGG